MPTSTGTYDTSTITYDQSSLSYDGFPAPLSGMPAVGVFVAWTGTPYEVNPTGGWTEISQYVRQITIRRGRQDDLQQFPPGAAQLVLDNNLRYFDPFNTAAPAPFNGNLVPRKQIKIVANWNGVEYPLYRGYVAGWPVEYADGGTDSTVTIDCFDLLGLIGRELSDTSYAEDYTLSLNPTVFIRCAQLGDFTTSSAGTTTRRLYAADTVVNRSQWPGFGWSVLANDTASASIGSAAQVSSQADGILTGAIETANNAGLVVTVGQPSNFPTASRFSWSCFCALTSADSALNFGLLRVNASLGYNVYLWSPSSTSTPGRIDVQFFNLTGGSFYFSGNTRMVDSAVHHYCVTVDTTTKTITVYLDGISIGTQVYTGDLATTNFPQWGGGSLLGAGKATFQHWALWEDRTLTADEVATIARFGLNFYNQPAKDRAQFYLNQTSLPSGFYTLDSDFDSNVGEYQIGAQAMVPEFHRLTAGDDGELFVTNQGVLRFYSGDAYFSNTRSNTSQVTFTDTGVGVEYDASAVRIDLNADQVRNTVVASASRDVQVRVSDATSVASYGDASENIETRLATQSDASTLANRVLTIFKNPKMTLEPFMSKGQQDPTYNWPRLLGLELLDRVTFKRTPATGSAIVKDLLVQSIEHRITPGEWQTVVNGSARYTNWFIVGVSLIGGDDLLLN